MADLPAGTVTFLFTDIEGSTRLLHEVGPERYAVLLSEHAEQIRGACSAHGGVEVDTQGDAFFLAFPTAPGALAAAMEVQAALAEGPVRVRIGLHTGTPLLGGHGYVGVDVNRAARIAAAAHGGQVLVSWSTRSLAGDGFPYVDLGEHRLKDLAAPSRLYQLGAAEFPPLRTLHRTNLPIQPAPLVGRERELAEAAALLREHRLVTLVGAGGSGKTRLGLQVAAEAVEDFPDGAWWVPLQALRDPALVEASIAQAVGADGGLAEHLADRRTLLLLDNFEHLVAAADTISALIAATPNARFLVTSREPLRISGEREYRIEPLAPDDAAALFRERATDAEPPEAVEEICRRLDHLPLAVELAAARTTLLRPAELLSRLERRLPLLTGGRRDMPERQRTMRATIEWSHELLAPAEQELFARLAVFDGSFDVQSAEAVCDGDIEGLQSLVEKSLVRRWESGRLGMLETIHEFARERLASSADADAIRRRHAEHFLALAEPIAERGERSSHLETWPTTDRRDHPDFRAALRYARELGDARLELLLAGALWGFLYATGAWEEARTMLEAALPAADSVPPVVHARAVRGAAFLASAKGDGRKTRELANLSLALYRQLGDESGIYSSLRFLAAAAEADGDLDGATSAYAKAAAAAREGGDDLGVASALSSQGHIALIRGDLPLAENLTSEALTLFRRIGRPRGVVVSLGNLALVALLRGHDEEAAPLLREALQAVAGTADVEGKAYAVEMAAVLVGRTGAGYERALELIAAGERMLAELGSSLTPVEAELRAEFLERARAELAEPAFERAWNAGGTLTADEAVDLAAATLAALADDAEAHP